MPLDVTHAFVSGIADDPVADAAGEVVPSDWNATHTVSGTPGGELGGTWASPTVDATHAGSTHSASTDTHIADGSAAHAASAVSFTPNGSIAATDVQAAIQEVRDEAVAATPTLEDVLTAGNDGGELGINNLGLITDDEGAGGSGVVAVLAQAADNVSQAQFSLRANGGDGAFFIAQATDGVSIDSSLTVDGSGAVMAGGGVQLSGPNLIANINSDTGAAGEALVSDGAGKVVWATPTGGLTHPQVLARSLGA